MLMYVCMYVCMYAFMQYYFYVFVSSFWVYGGLTSAKCSLKEIWRYRNHLIIIIIITEDPHCKLVRLNFLFIVPSNRAFH